MGESVPSPRTTTIRANDGDDDDDGNDGDDAHQSGHSSEGERRKVATTGAVKLGVPTAFHQTC